MSNVYPKVLLKFATQARQQGWSETEIITKLVAAGWAQELVCEVLKTIPAASASPALWQKPTWPTTADVWARLPQAEGEVSVAPSPKITSVASAITPDN